MAAELLLLITLTGPPPPPVEDIVFGPLPARHCIVARNLMLNTHVVVDGHTIQIEAECVKAPVVPAKGSPP